MEKNNYLKSVALAIFCGAFTLFNANANDNPFAGGTGTLEDPYLIETCEQLDEVRNYKSNSFKLIKDLDFITYERPDGTVWLPIGVEEPFQGTFDGNGYTISNIEVVSVDYASIFGVIDGGETRSAKVSKLVIKDCYFSGGSQVGALAGETYSCIIEQVAVINTQVIGAAGGAFTGAIVGVTRNQTLIENCYSQAGTKGKVSGNNGLGGITGYLHGLYCKVQYCYSDVPVITNRAGGGITGGTESAYIENSVALNSYITDNGGTFPSRIGVLFFGASAWANNYALETMLLNDAPTPNDPRHDGYDGESITADEATSIGFYAEKPKFAILTSNPEVVDYKQIWTIDTEVSPYPIFVWQARSLDGIGNDEKEENNIKAYVSGDNVVVEGLPGGARVSIYTISGTLVSDGISHSDKYEQSVTQNGIYIVNVISGQKIQVVKIIK